MAAIMRLSLVCVILMSVAVSAKNVPSLVSEEEINDITIIDDIRNFARSHPHTSFIPMKKEEVAPTVQSLRYSLGERVEGDDIVNQGSGNYNYSPAKDFNMQLNYPGYGNGAMLTKVEIDVTQTKNLGNAYVVAGGIGERSISIILEAENIEYLSYKAKYFGKY